MSVGRHLRIALDEYDARIRTFVPHYEEMIDRVADALHLVDAAHPTVVDLGIGTGALARACLAVRPDTRLIGIDADAQMLDTARARLGGMENVQLIEANFVEHALPAADAFVACIALHHIREPAAKQKFYGRVFECLRPGGVLISADCFPGALPALALRHHEAWLAHLEHSYPRSEAEAYLRAWAEEDIYFALEDELTWLRRAGFRPEVLWRREGFAVVAAVRTD